MVLLNQLDRRSKPKNRADRPLTPPRQFSITYGPRPYASRIGGIASSNNILKIDGASFSISAPRHIWGPTNIPFERASKVTSTYIHCNSIAIAGVAQLFFWWVFSVLFVPSRSNDQHCFELWFFGFPERQCRTPSVQNGRPVGDSGRDGGRKS